MQKLKDAEKRILEIEKKGNQEDIKTYFSNLKSLSDVVKDLNKIYDYDSICNKNKEKLIEKCNKEKELNIKIIIDLSYSYYNCNMDQIYEGDSGNDLKQLLLDIQKSSFYQEYKNNTKIQIMEIIMPRENIDFRDVITKLKILQKKFFDKDLNKDIKEYIKNFENEIANKEIEEVGELLKNKEYGIVLDKMEKLLKEINIEENFQDTAENYVNILRNIIRTKIEDGNKEIPEFQIFEDFLNKNKYHLDNYQNYKENLKALMKCKNSIKQEMEVMEMREKEDISSIFNKNDGSFNKRDRNKAEDYLIEIQKFIPETDKIEFRKCKEYIYKQISNFENEEKNNFETAIKWTENRNKYKKEINNINNIGKIYSYFNYLNKKCVHFDIHTIQLISLLILSKNKISNKMKGIFCKINTGEGKSTIIQFFAAYKVLCGNKVDVVSSSPVLAERDAHKKEKKSF